MRIAALLLAFCAVASHAESTGASWMRLPTDARTGALAGAIGSDGVGAAALGNNPAGLAEALSTEAVLTHGFWAQDVSREHLAVSRRVGEKVGIGISLDYVDLGEVEAYDLVEGVPAARGTLHPNAWGLGFGCGLNLAPRLNFGTRVQWLHEDLGGVGGTAPAFDLGLQWRGGDVRLGLSARNLGTPLNGAALPSSASLSVSYRRTLVKPVEGTRRVLQEVEVMAQGDAGLDDRHQNAFGTGVEYRYASILACRVGYRGTEYGPLTGVKGLTVGAGVSVRKLELSYAWVALGDMGHGSLFNLKAGF